MFPEQMSKEFVFQTPSLPYSHEVGYFRYSAAKFLTKDDVLSGSLTFTYDHLLELFLSIQTIRRNSSSLMILDIYGNELTPSFVARTCFSRLVKAANTVRVVMCVKGLA